jgi:hypothetical protein
LEFGAVGELSSNKEEESHALSSDNSTVNKSFEPSGNKAESSTEVTATINRHTEDYHVLQRSR